jgi:subtilisin
VTNAHLSAGVVIVLLAILAAALDPSPSANAYLGGEHSDPRAETADEVIAELQVAPKASVIVSLDVDVPYSPGARPPVDIDALRSVVAAAQSRVITATPPTESQVTRRYRAVPALAMDITQAGLQALERHPDVLHIGLDRRVETSLPEAVPLINANDVHQDLGVTGNGVRVAVLDTGIDASHALLSGSVVHEECFLVSGNCPGGGTTGTSAADGHGHGTHVSGIITSSGPPAGVAPNSLIAAFKVLNDDGTGSFADVLAAFDTIVADHPDVQVINMSIVDGGSHAPGVCDALAPSFATTFAIAKSMGMISVAASGNNGSKAGIAAPACFSDVVSVGAVYDANVGTSVANACIDSITSADQVACWSQSSADLDILAPGAMILSTIPGGAVANAFGTSMASPMAAGVAALMLEVDPGLTPIIIEARLKETGVPVTDAANSLTRSRVDAFAAVSASQPVGGIAILPDQQLLDRLEHTESAGSRLLVPLAALAAAALTATTITLFAYHAGYRRQGG